MSTEEGYTCPICGHDCRSRNHLRDHIHEDHRKSQVIDSYLAELDL